MAKFKDLANQRFGRLIVLYSTGERAKNEQIVWLCRCDCGNLIKTRNFNLVYGHTQSCGCLQRERTSKANFKHGDTKSRPYAIWRRIRDRCSNPNDFNYKWYGGRGISVCEEWANSYIVFKTWAMANGYKDNLTIDRINNMGNYEPSNCQWITQSENSSKKPKHKLKKGDSN